MPIKYGDVMEMADKSFANEFDKACRRLGGDFMRLETDRVHRDATRDKQNPNHKVDIKGPEPWRRSLWMERTGLTL